MLRSTLFACAAAMAFAGAAPALAQYEDHSQEVRFGDLNLKNPADAHELLGRIDRAAANVCGANEGRQETLARSVTRRCDRAAQDRAVYDVSHPEVTAQYYGVRPEIVIEGSYDPD